MSEIELMRQILEPLLEDYHYWFERSQRFLEEETLDDLLSGQEQADLMSRIQESQAELMAAESLYKLSDSEVGIDPGLMAKWHRLLMECAELGRRFRLRTPSSEA
ncbi:MAG: DUF2605 domain-containing protein [Synechococcaceae cyanobacterium SM2_3_2]|nr:DUF2605 domain-containing protein [Synechococcaceae cyanobacterium SM2_3_2]